MIEAASAPLVSILGPEIGEWFTRLHTAEGVRVLCDCTVDRALGNGRVVRLQLSNGQIVDTDHVVVGVGVEPNVGWLERTALARPEGIPVDGDGRTAIDGVIAIGDVACTFDPLAGRHVPGSHWEAASRQAVRAARAVVGLAPGATPLTSFWTDQYGIRIQYLGHAWLADSVEIDGEPGDRSFTATFLRARRPVAGLIVDRARALPTFRKLIETGAT
jgi:NADPH-dependent 2,4-dienoyl-CoA reductase/sulfur reductase-like enzyme